MMSSQAWKDVAKAKHEADLDENHRLDEERAAAAKAHVVKQLNKLRAWIRRVGHGEPPATTFGQLFEAAQGDMPTLSGTLVTARRLGVVQWEGEHLLQGRDNAVSITLAKDDVPGDHTYDVAVHGPGKHGEHEERDPFVMDAQVRAVVPCARCGKTVLSKDRVCVVGLTMHHECFECAHCKQNLTQARYASIDVHGQTQFFCIPHYQQQFKTHADYEHFKPADASHPGGPPHTGAAHPDTAQSK